VAVPARPDQSADTRQSIAASTLAAQGAGLTSASRCTACATRSHPPAGEEEDIASSRCCSDKKLNTTAHYTQVATEVLHQVVSPIEGQRKGTTNT